MPRREAAYWVFSNAPEGRYDGNHWDQRTIIRTKRYYLRENQANRRHVRSGDVGVLRVFGEGYAGRFLVGDWHIDSRASKKYEVSCGYFDIRQLQRWKRTLPHYLVHDQISNKNVRGRLLRITRDDFLRIETAQGVYARLGYGPADGQIILLEKGIEEAIKVNLDKLGLKLAKEEIAQQFSMGPGVGRSDLICEDENGDLVALELKRGQSSDEVIGQVLRYVAYVRENIAKKRQNVRGWVIVGDYDEHLRLAASAANVRLLTVRLP